MGSTGHVLNTSDQANEGEIFEHPELAYTGHDTRQASIWVLSGDNVVKLDGSSDRPKIDCRFTRQARLKLLPSKPAN